METLNPPPRIFLAGSRRPVYDPDGFVLPLPRGEIFSIEDLLEFSAVLVVAPPWTGKSFVAERLDLVLSTDNQPARFSFEFHEFTSFEILGRGAPIEPPWWSSWKSGTGSACWILDAIDEDERRDRRVYEVLTLIQRLTNAERSRLHLLFLARLNEISTTFEKRLDQVFGDWSPERPLGIFRVRMAGLDREAAKDLIGTDRFERVCGKIRDNRWLIWPRCRPFWNTFVSAMTRALPREEVWRGVLEKLLRVRGATHKVEVEIEDSFEVTQRIAVVLTFSGEQSLGIDPPNRPNAPSVEALFPEEDTNFKVLREATRQAVRTAVFERSERGFRFAQDHVREWFAAFSLKSMPLARLRPLLTTESGSSNPYHHGLMGILHQISPHPEVRDWIVAAHGGVVPPSDSAPWSLEQAKRALDLLQDMARSSSWGLDLWQEERLDHFAILGMGPELAHRLNLPLQPPELQLLLDIAIFIGAPEPLNVAARLLQDPTQDERVRSQAARLLDQVGTREDFEPLDEWARSIETSSEDSGLPILVSSLYEKKLWSFEEVAAFSLAREETERGWLQHVLSRDLSLGKARWLVRRYLLRTPRRISAPLLRAALQKIIDQVQPSIQDCKIVSQLFLTEEFDTQTIRLLPDIHRFFQRSQKARQALFRLGMKTDPDTNKRGSWRWSTIIQKEDLDWLLGLLSDHRPAQSLILRSAYHLAHRGNVTPSTKKGVRKEIRARDPKLLKKMDQDRKTLRQMEQRMATQLKQEADAQIHDLEALVRDTVASQDLELCDKMRRLSWSCFTSPGRRPTNISGRWNDLPSDLRSKALEVCREALTKCNPTPIPEESSFSSSILWEAACFHHILIEAGNFPLTGNDIRRWLPSILKAWEGEWEFTLRRCFEVDRESSESVFLEAITREGRSGDRSSYLAQELPLDLWSESLVERLEGQILDTRESEPELRIHLLLRISRVLPERARTIAQRWADLPIKDKETRLLHEGGVDLLLQVSPVEGWPYLQALIDQEEASQVLVRMHALLPNHFGPDAQFSTWPSILLRDLTQLLYRVFPPETDPVRQPGVAYSLDAEDDLRGVRVRLPKLLFQRNQPGDSAVLEQLAGSFTDIRSWLDQARAQRAAEGVLAGIGIEDLPRGGTVPLLQMVRLLIDERYTLLRTTEDLQEVVVQELSSIAKDSKEYLALLYRPSEGRGKKRTHLHEEALQAYVCCRLRDRLVPGVLEPGKTVIFIDREPLAAQNQRNDVKIQAESINGKPLTTIVEVKWSDNKDVSTSLTEQLAKDYLLKVDLTHGVYLVGWCGKGAPWRKDAIGERPPDKLDMEAWRKAFSSQAVQIEQQLNVSVRPLVFDLRWN